MARVCSSSLAKTGKNLFVRDTNNSKHAEPKKVNSRTPNPSEIKYFFKVSLSMDCDGLIFSWPILNLTRRAK